jgi:hypothetical protein
MAKVRIAFVYILILYGCIASSYNPPHVSIEAVYNSQVGVVEQPRGSNSGPEVRKYLRSVKTTVPAPWCAAFVHWCLDSAGIANNITAYSPTAINKNNLVYYRGRLIKPITPGDVFTIYFVSMGRIGHTGFCGVQLNATVVQTVEGNSNDGGSREGYGVFRRKRPLHTLYSISRW